MKPDGQAFGENFGVCCWAGLHVCHFFYITFLPKAHTLELSGPADMSIQRTLCTICSWHIPYIISRINPKPYKP